MTEQDKQLLLKDLSARLPYGVKINRINDYTLTMEDIGLNAYHLASASFEFIYRRLRPYLRLMSGMTEEEKNEYNKTKAKIAIQWDDYGTPTGYELAHTIKTFDWLNAHHFDYRGLIKKGLALEAPEGMYKTK